MNATLSALTPGLANFKETADDLEEELTASPSGAEPWNGKGRVQYWLEVGIPAFVSAPFVIFIVLTVIGLLFSCCSAKKTYRLLPEPGRVLGRRAGPDDGPRDFRGVVCVSITMADFCYLGPASVLTERAKATNARLLPEWLRRRKPARGGGGRRGGVGREPDERDDRARRPPGVREY